LLFLTEGLRRFPWRAYGLTEDLEFSWLLRLGGERVHFVPETAVRGEMVSSGGPAAASQRQRWEVGRRRLRRTLTGPLLKSPRLGWGRKLVYLVDLYAPPLVPLVASWTLVAVANLLLARGLWLRVNLALDLFMLAALVLYVLSPFVALKLPWRYARELAYVPFYALWKVAVALRRSPTAWVRTERERV
jgi:cellulose synthase/poly-beta-1,6-N-acetylglucosamine synthase-like glycosyltransferase